MPTSPSAYVKRARRHARSSRQQVLDALRFKCDVLWAQLDALHHAYVEPGRIPPGAFVPEAADDAGRRHEPGRRRPSATACPAAAACSCASTRRATAGCVLAPERLFLPDEHRGRDPASWSMARRSVGAHRRRPRRPTSTRRATRSRPTSSMLQDLADKGFLRRDEGQLSRLRSRHCRHRRWPEPPLALLAELTHRCPLHCPYCSNPLELERVGGELDTATWRRVLRRGRRARRAAGAFLRRRADRAARSRASSSAHAGAAGLYTNLITSGVLLDGARVHGAGRGRARPRPAQLPGRRARRPPTGSAAIAAAHAKKLAVARLVRDAGLPLTVNAVVHRQNLDRLERDDRAGAGARRATGSRSRMCSITAGP